MALQKINTQDIVDGGVKRDDLNTATTGQAVIRKVVAGSGISITATGVDAGTGDATIGIATVTANKVMVSNAGGLPVASSISVDGNGALFPLKSPYGVIDFDSEGAPMLGSILPLALCDRGDMARFKSPSSPQYWNGAAWVTWTRTDWTVLTDGRGTSGIPIDFTHRKFRLSYDAINSYSMVSFVQIQRSYMYPQRSCTLTVEDSPDGITWTTRTNAATLNGVYATHFVTPDTGSAMYGRYFRITFDYALSAGETFYLTGIQLVTFRNGDQGGVGLNTLLPIDWDGLKNISMPGKLTVNTITPSAMLAINYAGDAGTMPLPYEVVAVQRDGDTKLSILCSNATANPMMMGASFCLGFSRFTMVNGNYPAMDFQHLAGSYRASNLLHINFLERNAGGIVVNYRQLAEINGDAQWKISGQYRSNGIFLVVDNAINWNNGNVQRLDLSNGVNYVSMSYATHGARYLLLVLVPSGGGTIVFDGPTVWSSGGGGIVLSPEDAYDIISFVYNEDFDVYFAAVGLDFKA